MSKDVVAWLYHDGEPGTIPTPTDEFAGSVMLSLKRQPMYRNETPLYAAPRSATPASMPAGSMSNDMERERFEAWAVENHNDITRNQYGKYHSMWVQGMWVGWKKARATPAPAEAQAVRPVGYDDPRETAECFHPQSMSQAASIRSKAIGRYTRALFAAPPTAGAEREGWISVEERLPELWADVLVALSTGTVERGSRITGTCWHWDPTDLDDDEDASVTHWLALPAAPSAPSDQQGGRT